METILMGEINLHENYATPKFSNVHEMTSDICVQDIALCMWISCQAGNDGTIIIIAMK